MAPRGPTVFSDPPPGLFRAATTAPNPTLTVSARIYPDVDPRSQGHAFARLVAKTIHSHFPSSLTPESLLTEHPPYILSTGYIRVGFTIDCPEAVTSLAAATAATGTLALLTTPGCIQFADPRVSWTNYSTSYTRQLFNVPSEMDEMVLVDFISTEKCKCHLVKAAAGASGSTMKGRFLVTFTVSSITDIPSSIQIPGPQGSSYLIDVRMPQSVPSVTETDGLLDTPVAALPRYSPPAWTGLPRQPAQLSPLRSSVPLTSPRGHQTTQRGNAGARRAAAPASAQQVALEEKRLAKMAQLQRQKARAELDAIAAAELAQHEANVNRVSAQRAAAGAPGAGPSGLPRSFQTLLSPRPTAATAGATVGAAVAATGAVGNAAAAAGAAAAGAAAVAVGEAAALAAGTTCTADADDAEVTAEVAAASAAAPAPPRRTSLRLANRHALPAPATEPNPLAEVDTDENDSDYEPMQEEDTVCSSGDESMDTVSLASDDYNLGPSPPLSPRANAAAPNNGDGAPPSQH